MEIGEVYISNTTRNYFRIDEINGDKITVTRLGFEYEGRDVVQPSGPYYWPADTFQLPDFRRITRNAAKFEAFLRRTLQPQKPRFHKGVKQCQ